MHSKSGHVAPCHALKGTAGTGCFRLDTFQNHERWTKRDRPFPPHEFVQNAYIRTKSGSFSTYIFLINLCPHASSQISTSSMHAHTPSRILTNKPRPVSMHQNDQTISALSKESTEPVQAAVPEHVEPSACCPCVVDEALCDTPKCAESWQPSFLRLHAAWIERDMYSVDIDCILADHDDAFASQCAIAAEEDANTQGALENTSAAAAEAADSQASPLPSSSPAIGIDAGFFKSYAQHIKAQRSMLCKTMLIQPATSKDCPLPPSSPAIRIDPCFFKSYAQHIKAQRSMLCKTMLIQPATSTDCEDDLENRFKLRRGRTRERVQR